MRYGLSSLEANVTYSASRRGSEDAKNTDYFFLVCCCDRVFGGIRQSESIYFTRRILEVPARKESRRNSPRPARQDRTRTVRHQRASYPGKVPGRHLRLPSFDWW